jgi:hypothetical protein
MALPHTTPSTTATLSPPLPDLLPDFKRALQTLYPDQLVGLVLFGSQIFFKQPEFLLWPWYSTQHCCPCPSANLRASQRSR